jgi:hypothetical protein
MEAVTVLLELTERRYKAPFFTPIGEGVKQAKNRWKRA